MSGDGRGIFHSRELDDAVWDLAYDLQEFLQLRVFDKTDSFTENEIMEIKNRQSGKDTSRFSNRLNGTHSGLVTFAGSRYSDIVMDFREGGIDAKLSDVYQEIAAKQVSNQNMIYEMLSYKG